MKKKNNYPDWVEKYRAPGVTIRKTPTGYALYKCTSTYVKGSTPKSVQEYLGKVTEKDGFIPKAAKPSSEPVFLEYGLSHFILQNFKRELRRASSSNNEDIIQLGIIYFIFGDISSFSLSNSLLTADRAQELLDYYARITPKRIMTVSKKIDKVLEEEIPDETDRRHLIDGLKMSVWEKGRKLPENHKLLPNIKEIIERYGLNYE